MKIMVLRPQRLKTGKHPLPILGMDVLDPETRIVEKILGRVA